MPVITAQNISHAYGIGAERREVLRSLDLTVSTGEVVVLTGASGAGKTTLLTLCGALRSLQQGELQVLGNDLRGLNREQQRNLRSSIGFVFQSHNLLEALTAGQNVVMSLLGRVPVEAAGELAEAALGALGLSARIDAFPEELSGGEKQRVAVARALIRKPTLILADEPTASLDDASAAVVKESIRQAAKSTACAVLLVTHDARVFDIADRVLQLVEGTIMKSPEHSIPVRRRESSLSP